MKHRHEDIGKTLDRLLARYATPAPDRMRSAIDRIGTRLQSGIVRGHAGDASNAEPPSSARGLRPLALATAAAALLAIGAAGAAIGVWRASGGPPEAIVEAVDGGLYRVIGQASHQLAQRDRIRANELLRANGGNGAVFVLADGSRVEMRSQSELALERAADGLRIRLSRGGIIVNAAKQRTGRLYVETKDVTVSVVGTVFVVNADDNGSRVAVIEGEVRVQQGAAETTLLQGEQMATGPKTSTAPALETFAWSRSADEHVALLQQFAVPAPISPARDVPQEAFEVISIRRSTVQASDSGRGRGAGGGVSRRNRRGDDPCSLGGEPVVDPRRFDAVNATLVQLVSWAYGLDCWMNRGPDVLFGGPPDWIKKDGFDVQASIPEGSPGYTSQQLRSHDAPALQLMLQSMLTNRFGLATRRETREMPVYVLGLAAGGPKYTRVNSQGRLTDLNGNTLDKPVVVNGIAMPGRREAPADHVSPEFSIWVDGDTRNLMQLGPSEIHGRRKTVVELARILSLYAGRPVLDRTNLKGQFNFFFEFAVMECTTCPFTAPGPDARRPEDGTPWPDRSLFAVLEQVGLELKPSREQVEVLVIERVERPTEN